MTVGTLYNKPFTSAARGFAWVRAINWGWWLKRAPMFLLGVPAAYGVSQFAAAYLPAPFHQIAGGAFEATYIGAIAMADQQYDDQDWVTTLLWWLVNLAAVTASVLSNLLFFSGGAYGAITAEIMTHAVPLPVLGFFYGLLLHRTSTKAARQASIDAEIEAAKVNCRYCGIECRNVQAEYSHFRTCPNHPKRGQL